MSDSALGSIAIELHSSLPARPSYMPIDLWMYVAPISLFVWLCCNTLDHKVHGDFR
jgi:hypothetical protein